MLGTSSQRTSEDQRTQRRLRGAFHGTHAWREAFKTKLDYNAVMVKAKTGIEGYLGITKYGSTYMVRCTTAGYQQAVSIFSSDELDSPLPHANMHLHTVHRLPWNATDSGLVDLFSGGPVLSVQQHARSDYSCGRGNHYASTFDGTGNGHFPDAQGRRQRKGQRKHGDWDQTAASAISLAGRPARDTGAIT